jgi:hypothetical protein
MNSAKQLLLQPHILQKNPTKFFPSSEFAKREGLSSFFPLLLCYHTGIRGGEYDKNPDARIRKNKTQPQTKGEAS